ncbi:MAG TPA: Uma2 family endonuclease [Chloroflexota bacterium]|nr:Uma2 family endonuclease [Chloroflexota bacterium]
MCALRSRPFPFALTPEDLRFLRNVADDTEDAPWMTMNDAQWRNATALYASLDAYARQHAVSWYPGGMLPLTYRLPGESRPRQVAPDVFVARVPLRGRSSLPVDEEGMPPFVLEVVSSSSVQRDLEEKTEIYRLLGAQEYAIVRLDVAGPRLEGYRRGTAGAWEVWAPDAQGRLWSAVLGLWLVLRGDEVRAVTPTGEMLRTLPEAEAERQQAKAAQERAEEEVARLRVALERLTHGGDDTAST